MDLCKFDVSLVPRHDRRQTMYVILSTIMSARARATWLIYRKDAIFNIEMLEIMCNATLHSRIRHRHRNRWTANSDEIWLNLRRACPGSKPDTLLPVF